jgi:hypothetical protein
VCFSAVVDPFLSPQYGFQGNPQFVQAEWAALPVTKTDKIALDWVSGHAMRDVVSDGDSAAYLIFVGYRSGVFSNRGIEWFYGDVIDPTPGPNAAFFFRWSNAIAQESGAACHGLTSTLSSRQSGQIVNILYSNSCDILEANPAWMQANQD